MENGWTWMNMGGWDQNNLKYIRRISAETRELNFTTEWDMWKVSTASSKDGSKTKSNMVRVKLLTASPFGDNQLFRILHPWSLQPALGCPSKSIHFGSRNHWKKCQATVTEGSLGADLADRVSTRRRIPPDPPVRRVLTELLWTGSPKLWLSNLNINHIHGIFKISVRNIWLRVTRRTQSEVSLLFTVYSKCSIHT